MELTDMKKKYLSIFVLFIIGACSINSYLEIPNVDVITETNNARPCWRWDACYNATGYRYKISGNNTWRHVSGNTRSFIPNSNLPEGRHTIYVQSTIDGQNYSLSGKATVTIRARSHQEQPLVIAHRGSSAHAPENTIASIKKAVEQGAAAVEIDIHRTMDNHIVALHDITLDRTTNGGGPVYEKSLAQIKQLDAGSWFSTDYAGESIPTLEEILNYLQDKDIQLFIEFKSPGRYNGIVPRVLDLITLYNLGNRVHCISFDLSCITEIESLQPDIKTAYLTTDIDTIDFDAFTGDALNVYYRSITNENIEYCTLNTIPLYVWTIDGKNDLVRFIRPGIAGITTNKPDTLLTMIEHEFIWNTE